MVLIIAGSRSLHPSTAEIAEELRQENWPMPDIVLSGGAIGVDHAGEAFAKERRIEVWRFPANWEEYGRKAGPIRNAEMAKNATHLLAFWDGKSPGTNNMIQTALRHSLKVKVTWR